MRILNFAAFFMALASAFLLYSLSYDTRRMEARVQWTRSRPQAAHAATSPFSRPKKAT